jgi:hypothetical protein
MVIGFPPAPGRARRLISALASIFRRGRAREDARARYLEDARTHDLAAERELDAENNMMILARDLNRARELVKGRDIVELLDSDRASELAPSIALVGALNIIAILDRGLGLDLDRGPAIGRFLDIDPTHPDGRYQALVLVHNRDVAGDIARYLDQYLNLGRDVADDIGRATHIALVDALDHARAIVRELDSHELDASGEDLSGIEIRHLDALDGITWTRETTWPTEIAGDVEENSYEIKPGVWQVHLGDARNRHALTLV